MFWERIPKELSARILEALQKKFCGWAPKRISESIPGEILERIPEEAPEWLLRKINGRSWVESVGEFLLGLEIPGNFWKKYRHNYVASFREMFQEFRKMALDDCRKFLEKYRQKVLEDFENKTCKNPWKKRQKYVKDLRRCSCENSGRNS